MKAEYWAVLTAFCWAFGSFLEKKGVKLGQFSPLMGAGIRTFFSLILFSLFTMPFWGQLKTASVKSFILIAIGGGLIAGFLGLSCFYSGIKDGRMATVLTIAFCLTPLLGVIIGYFALNERLSHLQIVGIVMTIIGATITVLDKPS